jgi:hypothetical protein
MNIDGTLGDKYALPLKTRPFDFGTDAIERQRVSLGQSLIDADFEYGLQSTKWQTYQEIRRFPSFYETPGTDFYFSNVQIDTTTSISSNVVIYFSNAISTPPSIGTVLSTTGLANADRNADRAEGFFLVTNRLGTDTGSYANTCNYSAKGLVTGSSNIQTAYTTIRRGGIFNGGSLKIPVSSISADPNPGTNVSVTTTVAHGIMPGTPISSNSSGATFNGNFFVSNVNSATTFNVVCGSTVTVPGTPANANIYMNPYGYTQHRPFDGGVILSPNQPSYGAAVTRQSKKVFRYQSGKGLLWSSGTLFCPNNDISSISVSGPTTTLSSNANGYMGVSLTVANPALLGLNQNVTFGGQTSFGTANVSTISGNNATFLYNGTFSPIVPANVTQNVVTANGSLYLFNGNVALPVVSTTGFGTNNLYSVSGVSTFTGNVVTATGSTLTSNFQGTLPGAGFALGASVTLATPIATTAFVNPTTINVSTSSSQTYFPALSNVTIGGNQANVVTTGQAGSWIRLQSNTGGVPTWTSFAPGTLVTKNSVTSTGAGASNAALTLGSSITTYNSNSAVNGISGFTGNVISTVSGLSTINASIVNWTTIPNGTLATFGQQATVTGFSNLITFGPATTTGQPFSGTGGLAGSIITGQSAGTPSPVAITSWPGSGLPTGGSVNFVQTGSLVGTANTIVLTFAGGTASIPSGSTITGSSTQNSNFAGVTTQTASSSGSTVVGVNVTSYAANVLPIGLCNVVVGGANYTGNSITSATMNLVFGSGFTYPIGANTQVSFGGTQYANVLSAYTGGSNVQITNDTAQNFPPTGIPVGTTVAFTNVASISASTSNLSFTSAFAYPIAATTQITFNGAQYASLSAVADVGANPNVQYVQSGSNLPSTGIPIGTPVTFGPAAVITSSIVNFTNVNVPNQVFVAGEPITVLASAYQTTVSTVAQSNISFGAYPASGTLPTLIPITPKSTLSLGSLYQTPIALNSYINFPTAGANVQVNMSSVVQTATAAETTSLTLLSAAALPAVSCVSPYTTLSKAYALQPTVNIASTNGFSVGDTVTFPANTYVTSNLGATTIATITPQTASSNGIFVLNFTGNMSNTSAIIIGETIAGQTTNITGTVPVTMNIAGSQIFSTGQTVASILAPNIGTVTISSAPTTQVSGNTQVNLSYTGSFPPSGFAFGTSVTTLPPGSNITAVTSIAHGAPQLGAIISLKGVGTSNINGSYTVASINDSKSLNVTSTGTITTLNTVLGDQPRFIVTGWHGASVRAGCFDDQNGMFWEYDGQTLFVCRRSSTFQLTGFATATVNGQQLLGTTTSATGTFATPTSISIPLGATSVTITTVSHTITYGMYTTSLTGFTGLGVCWVIGTPTPTTVTLGFLPATAAIGSGAPSGTFVTPSTRFQDQLRINDKFTIRGMTHQVTSIQGQGVLTFNPPYRGSSAIIASSPATVCRIKELRVAQPQFNRDPLDGTGGSGFKVDLTKMQMLGIQYTWYGAGFVDFMMRGGDGNWVYAHRFRNNNINDEAYMRTGNMPVRYELINESQSAVTSLAQDIAPGTSTLYVNDSTAYFPPAGTLMIDNELVSYTAKTANSFAVQTRGANLVYNVADINRTFSGQRSSNHLANTTVSLASVTCTPSLTHWGSAFLMDGQFDNDRGYFFNYSNTAVTLGGSTATVALPLAAVTSGFSAGTFPTLPSYGSALNAAVIQLKNPLSAALAGDTYQINGSSSAFNGITPTTISSVGGNASTPTVSVNFTGTTLSGAGIPAGTRITDTQAGRNGVTGIVAVAVPAGSVTSPLQLTLSPATGNFGIGDAVTFTSSATYGTWIVSNIVAPSQISVSYSSGNPPISTLIPTNTVITDATQTSVTQTNGAAAAAVAGSSGALSVASVNPAPYASPSITLYFPGPSIGPIPAGSIITSSTGTTATVSVNVPFTTWTAAGVTVTVQPLYNTIAVGDSLTGISSLTNPVVSAITTTSGTPTLTVSYTATTGSSITSGILITDGSVIFSTSGSVTPAAITASAAIAFLIRLAPAVSGGIVGDIGSRDLLNRAQLLLQKLEVTSPVNVQTTGFLNPVGLSVSATGWTAVNSVVIGSQPSFAQIYTGVTQTPAPGERIFSTIVQGNNQNNLDLSNLKEMCNAVIGGNASYPDGPDVLCIYVQNLTNTPATVQVNLFWTEAQA